MSLFEGLMWMHFNDPRCEREPGPDEVILAYKKRFIGES